MSDPRQPHATPRSAVGRLAWLLASLVLVMGLPIRLYLGVAMPALPVPEMPLVVAMGLGYGLAVALGGPGRGPKWTPLWAGPMGFGVAYAILLMGPLVPASRAVLVMSCALGTALLLLDRIAGPRVRSGVTVVVAGIAGVALVEGQSLLNPSEVGAPVGTVETHLTGLHGVRVTPFAVPALTGRSGGGLVRADSVLVMVDGRGSLGVLDPRAPESWRRIAVVTPMDTGPIRVAAGRDDHGERMRVMDLALRRDAEGWELFLSHHEFRLDALCFAVRLSRIRLESDLRSARPDEVWESVYETTPCVPYLQGDNAEPFFRGNDSGGRLAWLEPGVLLMSVGDHMVPNLARDPTSDFGKVLRVDVRGDSAETRHFTGGHRNPQGLTVSDGVVWAAEHGPQGGDELNVLVEGMDYGWGRTSLGTDYGSLTFTPSDEIGPVGADLQEPVHAWMPSPGISDVAVVEGRAFHRWQGDLLVASLKFGELRRLRVREQRVVYDEPIPLGRRIRALAEDAEGALWLWTDGLEVLRLEVDDTGAEAWGACTQCHALVENPSLVGPPLGEVEGRAVASVRGYAYSPALQAAGGTWTRARLDAFLADPQGFAPGTTMEMDPIRDPEARSRLLDYLIAADRR